MDYVIDSTTEMINSTGGVALVGKTLERIEFGNNPKIKYTDVLKSMVGLFSQGRTSFEEINIVRNYSFFRDSLNMKYVPAMETLRLYLERMAPDKVLIDTKVEISTIKLLKATFPSY